MFEKLFPYIENGIHIVPLKKGYIVTTDKTGAFLINTLEELTPEKFEEEIAREDKAMDLKALVHQKLGSFI